MKSDSISVYIWVKENEQWITNDEHVNIIMNVDEKNAMFMWLRKNTIELVPKMFENRWYKMRGKMHYNEESF